jgi:archaeal preflagellin peptidase FlaK
MGITEGGMLLAACAVVLVGGFGYASYADLRTREVSDRLWLLLGAIGFLVGLVWYIRGGWVPMALWVLAGLLVLEHLIPWDVPLERKRSWLPGAVELTFYAVIIVVFAVAVSVFGFGSLSDPSSGGVPIAAIAVVVGVFLARGLFELGILYGGADAKALMVASLVIPLDASPLLSVPARAGALLAYYPFALNVLMNAALLSAAIPLALAVTNLSRGEFSFPKGFVEYQIPVRELPERFVWLKDPLLDRGESAVEADTSEEDQRIRERQREALQARGVERVWVTPQLPFVVVLFGGVLLALLWGNVVFNLAALL